MNAYTATGKRERKDAYRYMDARFCLRTAEGNRFTGWRSCLGRSCEPPLPLNVTENFQSRRTQPSSDFPFRVPMRVGIRVRKYSLVNCYFDLSGFTDNARPSSENRKSRNAMLPSRAATAKACRRPFPVIYFCRRYGGAERKYD